MKENEDKKLEEETEKKSKKTLLVILAVTILVISVISLSFATLQQGENDNGANSISTGNISMNYTESINGISIENAMPTTDAVGKQLKGTGEYFDFTINSTIVGNVSVQYEIAAVKDKDSTIPDSDIKLYLEQQISGSYEEVMAPTIFTPIGSKSEIGSPAGAMILKTVTKNQTSTDNYRLRMWIKEDAQIGQDQSYTIKVNVYGKPL